MIMMILKRRRKHEKITTNQHRNERNIQSAYVNKLGRSKLKLSTFVWGCNNNEVWSDLLKLCDILLFNFYRLFFYSSLQTLRRGCQSGLGLWIMVRVHLCRRACVCAPAGIDYCDRHLGHLLQRYDIMCHMSNHQFILSTKGRMRWHESKLIIVLMSICTTIGGYTLEEDKKDELEKFFNLHPTLLIAGYITLSGFCKWNRLSFSCSESYPVFVSSDIFKWLIKLNWIQFTAILLYRICRCCSHLVVKLCHVFLHACTIPCVVIGGLVIWQYKERTGDVHFYSLHSWLGLATSGLFAFQFIIGFFR